jgi:enoyl-CoA hydratase/carnithine racemase
MATDFPTLADGKMLASSEGGIGWVVFNNPERRNAVSPEMWEAVVEIFDAFEADPDIRVVIMKGAGDKAFVSGADISQFEARRSNAEASALYSQYSTNGRAAMSRLSKPLIAMIRGYCIGGGMSTALVADVRIASDDAQFGIPAARLGLSYSFDSLRPLAELTNSSVAKDILFTGRRLKADEALRVGLVNSVHPADQLEAAVRAYAATIVDNAPLTVKAAKFTLSEVVKDPEDRDLDRVEKLNRDCMDSQDYAEGRRAFMEKRTPVFTGR